MDTDSQLDALDIAFRNQRLKAEVFIANFNILLPTDSCPDCSDAGHCPGLPCPACGYEHPVSWTIILDTEYGYDVVEIRNRKKVISRFNVE